MATLLSSDVDLPHHTHMIVYDLAEPLSSSTFVRGIQVAAKANSVWVSVGIHERPDPSSSTSGAAGKKGAAEDGTQQAPTAAKSNGQHRPDDSDSEDTRCYNTQCLISPDGEIADAYRKLHLFDVYLKDGLTVVESNTTIKGMDLPNVTQTSVGKGGLWEVFLCLSLSRIVGHGCPSLLSMLCLSSTARGVVPLTLIRLIFCGNLQPVGMLTCYDLRFPEGEEGEYPK